MSSEMGGATFPVRDLAPISKRHGTEGILSVLARNVGSPRRCKSFRIGGRPNVANIAKTAVKLRRTHYE